MVLKKNAFWNNPKYFGDVITDVSFEFSTDGGRNWAPFLEG